MRTVVILVTGTTLFRRLQIPAMADQLLSLITAAACHLRSTPLLGRVLRFTMAEDLSMTRRRLAMGTRLLTKTRMKGSGESECLDEGIVTGMRYRL